MTERDSKQEPEILNPRYAGATPEMVGRALLQPREPEEKSEPDGESRSDGDGRFQSSI